jgi:hypothetical protein
MTIQQLLENINNDDFNIEKELQVKKYLPLEEKKLIAKGIIYECTENVDGFIKVDSVQQHLSYIKFMIKYHTNLEYTSEDYDILRSTEYKGTDLMTAIFDTFQKDADQCNQILISMINDYVQDNSMEFIIAQFLHKITDVLSDKLDKFDVRSILPRDFDVDKLTKFLNTYVK